MSKGIFTKYFWLSFQGHTRDIIDYQCKTFTSFFENQIYSLALHNSPPRMKSCVGTHTNCHRERCIHKIRVLIYSSIQHLPIDGVSLDKLSLSSHTSILYFPILLFD